MITVLGLGSNKSFASLDSLHLLARASALLEPLFSDFRFSSVYRTKPMYVTDQSDFYNMVVSGRTELSPHELLARIHEIEELLGRDRKSEIRNGPRSVDIDIELYGNEEINYSDPSDSMKNLEVPHPRLCERAFVLIPLLEVLPPDADIEKRDFLEKSLAKTGSQGAEKLLDSGEFAGLIAETEAQYGRKDTCTVADDRKSGSN